MPDMFVEFDAVALDLPGAAVLRGKVVLIGIIPFLKTARERLRFLVGGFCVGFLLIGAGLCCRSGSGVLRLKVPGSSFACLRRKRSATNSGSREKNGCYP